MNIVIGDIITWEEPVFVGFRPAGPYWKATGKFVGTRTIKGEVINESYGEKTGQHTFRIKVLESTGYEPPSVGTFILRKGRNLYRNLIDIIDAPDKYQKTIEKSERSKRAAELREKRMYGKDLL